MNVDSKNRATELAPALRKTSQYLMPPHLNVEAGMNEGYNIYPVCQLGEHKIFSGYESLTSWIIKQQHIMIDGYVGVFWEKIVQEISLCLEAQRIDANWIRTADFQRAPDEIDTLVQPFMGTDESVWGTKCTLTLADLYNIAELQAVSPEQSKPVNIIIGPGAALAGWNCAILYIDLPKNELQFRMRAGSIVNLGANKVSAHFKMYKRFYFVDWVLLNAHKKALLNRITAVADGQWPETINWMYKTDLEEGLNKISRSVIRVRPWFEPGAWGGQWMKQHIRNLNTDVVNLAWSFELIVPENGLVFESDGNLLEVSFDTLMFSHNRDVLGRHADRFGDEFPIRFDFLDTYQGGNLSIQCHPKLAYIQENFGEQITQDETYYILDCEKDAQVYLGFQENIDTATFKSVLEESQDKGEAVAIEKFVQSHPAHKHELFLIPNGTVHSAGAGSLVLEISATPYIFTFKMYDWVRLDLDGNPRPINIEHAFNNLDFSRKGERVQSELISREHIIEQAADWQLIHLPTHAEHFYDVHRIEFDDQITLQTNNSCHILMLVEGQQVRIETADGTTRQYAYAETFVIPAAAVSYQLTNLGQGRAKVIKAFLK